MNYDSIMDNIKANTCTRGIRTGRISSPNTVDKISSPAALHFRKFQEFIISSSSCRKESQSRDVRTSIANSPEHWFHSNWNFKSFTKTIKFEEDVEANPLINKECLTLYYLTSSNSKKNVIRTLNRGLSSSQDQRVRTDHRNARESQHWWGELQRRHLIDFGSIRSMTARLMEPWFDILYGKPGDFNAQS